MPRFTFHAITGGVPVVSPAHGHGSLLADCRTCRTGNGPQGMAPRACHVGETQEQGKRMENKTWGSSRLREQAVGGAKGRGGRAFFSRLGLLPQARVGSLATVDCQPPPIEAQESVESTLPWSLFYHTSFALARSSSSDYVDRMILSVAYLLSQLHWWHQALQIGRHIFSSSLGELWSAFLSRGFAGLRRGPRHSVVEFRWAVVRCWFSN